MDPRLDHARDDLSAYLRRVQPEIEEAVLVQAYAVTEPSEAPPGPRYVDGLRRAIRAAIGYAITAVEVGGEEPPPIPDDVIAQAQNAARQQVELSIVLRRCLAGRTVMDRYLLSAARTVGVDKEADLQILLGDQASAFDHLISVVTTEHTRQVAVPPLPTANRRLTARIKRLLNGHAVDVSDLPYEFVDAFHLGIVAVGPAATDAVSALMEQFEHLKLTLRPDDETVWAWLGGRRRTDPAKLIHIASTMSPIASLAIGEPAHGLRGWRLTHRQAEAASSVALRSSKPLVRHADVALLAAMLRDPLLATSICEQYLAPLDRDRDGGEAARLTLSTYIAANQNTSSTAAALRVSPRTITKRLRAIEAVVRRPICNSVAEIEAALQYRALIPI